MSPKARKALTIGAVSVGVLLLLTGVANAADVIPGDDDDDDDDDLPVPPVIVDPIPACPPGQVLVQGQCVVPPPAPNPINCNYVGCGPSFNWNMRDLFPNERAFGLALQQLGYIINPATATFSIVSPSSRAIVRQFQRDYNVARTAQTVEPTPSGLATDGLIGNLTIAAIRKAQQWVQTLALPWMDIVALG
jgi:hypothetical protein